MKIKNGLFLLVTFIMACTVRAGIVYQDNFTGSSISSNWTVDVGSAVTLDDPNDQLDYNHPTAGTARRFFDLNSSLVGQTGYLKATISNFTGSASIWIGFAGSNPGNSTYFAQTVVTGNGTYEMFINNTSITQNYNNGAGWTGSLVAGTGVWRVNGGVASSLVKGINFPAAGNNFFGFGFANFTNTSTFPISSFSVDSMVVGDSLTVAVGGNVAPTFTSDPIVKAAAVAGTAYSGQTLAGSATDTNAGDTLTYSKVVGPDWLKVASNGTLSGTPDYVGSPSRWTVMVSDGNGGSNTAQLRITVTATYPYFQAETIKKTAGVAGEDYVNAITGSAVDDTDIHLTFAKVSKDSGPGADWLTVGPNGALSGTPTTAGTFTWTISVTDSVTNNDTATLEIVVDATTGSAKPINVIVIVSDDAGYADFSFMDGLAGSATKGGTLKSIVPTPNLDELSNRGVTFARAYVAANCQPTRSAIVTGAYQQRIGQEVVGNNIHVPNEPGYENVYEGIPAATDTVWDRFKALNYTTGAIGKWHIGSMPDDPSYGFGNRPERQGIDYFVGMWHGSRFFDMGGVSSNDEASKIRKVVVTDHTPATLAFTDNDVEFTSDPEYPLFVNDPNNGYITTIFGRESARFVAEHYDDPTGFFLYLAHPAPHKPWETNSPDYTDLRIAGMPNTVTGGGPNYRKIVASMTITMDKEIGRMMDALEDPNGDGDPSDSIVNDTLVIFINDNGGVSGAQTNGVNGTDNGWLDGFKGSAKEGGIRVPMILAGAGVDPSVADTIYYKAVHGVDIVATSLAVTGNPLPANEPNIDGINILPFVNGTDTNPPHDLLVHRWRGNFTVIKGDYNFVNTGNNGQTNQYRLYKVATGDAVDDIGQATNLLSGTPTAADLARRDEGFRDLTDHEVKFDKGRYPILDRTLVSEPLNVFDYFVFRPNTTTTNNNWFGNLKMTGTGNNQVPDSNSVSHWHQAGNTSVNRFLLTSDASPQTILEFPVYNSGSYTANNDLLRQSGRTFMLNKIILSGPFSGGSNATATISGLDLLFTNTLSGSAPRVQIDATNGANAFSFAISVNLILYHDFMITGNGTSGLNISGEVKEYEPGSYNPRNLIKEGSSSATLGPVSYRGDTTVNGGTLSLSQKNTSNDLSCVHLAASGATLNLAFSGTDTVSRLYIGGVQQPAGVYQAMSNNSPGGNKIPQITGAGTLTVSTGTSTYASWATANAPGQTADQDYDFDGVKNGIEYFMGESGSSATVLPGPDSSGKTTWPMGSTYAGVYGTAYVIQTSTPGLSSWADVPAGSVTIVPGVSVAYTFPTGPDRLFARLVVYQ